MNFFNSIVTKLWLTIILIVTTVLIILTIVLSFYFRNFMLNSLDNELSKEMMRVENFILTEHYSDRMDTLHLYEDNTIIYVDGTMASTQTELDRELFNRIIETETEGNTFILDDVMSESFLVKVSNLSTYFEHDVVIVMYRDLSSVQQSLNAIIAIFIISALIINFITTVFAFFLINRITAPLISLKQGLFKLSSNKNINLPVRSRDEIGELTLAFNSMSTEINNHILNLEHEKNMREAIFSSIEEGILYFGESGKLLYQNLEGERIYHDSLNDDIDNEFRSLFTNIENLSGIKDSQESLITVRDEHYNVAIIPVNNLDGEDGLVIVIRNITDAVNADEMKSDFITNVSHELKTPMVMLSGYSEALLDDVVTDPDEVKEMISIIREESLRMNSMVNELIQVSRLEKGDELFKFETFDLIELFQQLENTFKKEIENNQISFTVNIDESIEVYADYDKLIQVFTNLLDNSIRYTTINDKITVSANDTHEVIEILFADTGTGIDAKNQQHIFDRFYKVDEARTRGKHGTGLGLYIVRQIIEHHSGEITLESTLGEGTTFIIQLPKQREGKLSEDQPD